MLINSLWIIKDEISSIDFGALILSAFRTLIYYLDQIIYEFIINIYNLFRILCNTRITDDGKIISELAYRIGLILGLVMFFYVTFDFIQILIDPDKIQDKEKGPLNIIKKFIIVIVLLGTSTFIFDYMHRFQEIILHDGNDGVSVIERLILPYEINSDNFGKAISANFMKQFYKITGDSDAESATPVESDEGFTYEVCKENAETLPSKIASYGSMEDGLFCLNARYETDDGSRFYIEFNLLSLPIGIVVAWMLIMYCISVGMRVIQLMFLEIISPVAFVSYLSPKKDNMFGKFWKVYFATYIDVFIRIAIIDFIVLLSGVILETDNLWESASSTETFWLSVFMILALLSFAKKAPDLIKKFLPESASGLSLGLQTPKQFLKDITSSPLAAPVKIAGAPVGLLARKTVGGFDSLAHGHGFMDGWNRQKSKFGGWLDKKFENLTPYSYQEHKKSLETKREGQEEVAAIDKRWEEGAKIAEILQQYVGAGRTWTSAFDSTARNDGSPNDERQYREDTIEAYRRIYKNEKFINTKLHLDYTKSVKEKLEHDIEVKRSNGTLTDSDLKNYETAVKALEGAQSVHDSMRKQYHDSDAKVEDQFKFIKGNEVNPAKPSNNRTDRGIGL